MRRLAKWALVVVFSVSTLAWCAGAGIVALVDPQSGAISSDPKIEAALARAFRDDARVPAIFANGYSYSSRVTFGDDLQIRYRVTRGPLDRSAGTFPLSVCYTTNAVGQLKEVRLEITEDRDWTADWGENTTWTVVAATSRVVTEDGWATAVATGSAPAGATASRIVEVCHDGGEWSTGRSIPVAPTGLGRAHDVIGSWPLFSWVPKLR